MPGNRIELHGKLAKGAELRVTPAGRAVLRIAVRCGAAGDDLVLAITFAGEQARQLAARLKSGDEVSASGTLRTLRVRADRSEIEVIADSVVETGQSS